MFYTKVQHDNANTMIQKKNTIVQEDSIVFCFGFTVKCTYLGQEKDRCIVFVLIWLFFPIFTVKS